MVMTSPRSTGPTFAGRTIARRAIELLSPFTRYAVPLRANGAEVRPVWAVTSPTVEAPPQVPAFASAISHAGIWLMLPRRPAGRTIFSDDSSCCLPGTVTVVVNAIDWPAADVER